MIPLAALVGVMFMVVIGTFAWSSFRILHKIPRSDALVLILVSGVTVAADLAIAVAVGVIVSALVFAWESAKRIDSSSSVDDRGTKIYRLKGPLFFGSTQSFYDLFTPQDDPEQVVIDFRSTRVSDHSALEAINNLTERYLKQGKKLRLKGLSEECRNLLDNAGSMIEVNHDDPKYRVATNELA
jgi:SulP family sulfate permease